MTADCGRRDPHDAHEYDRCFTGETPVYGLKCKGTDKYPADPREPKLPKWAQEELRLLRMRLREADKVIAEMHGQNPSTDIFVRDYVNGDWDLPKHSRVLFMLEPKNPKRFSRKEIEVSVRDGELYVYGTSTLRITPNVSNVVKIGFDR
ncbi:hypothetical protein ABZV77_11390 [Streptomyces sp. NPDC004732]|uniref:DUF7239 family protein n=1 Tax=Streptomyces sp. NPDC004732 TaxID=3154290 RepID=UPI0033B7DFA8